MSSNNRNFRDFLWQASLRLLGRAVVLLLPLVGAIVFGIYLERNQIRAFTGIPGNTYEINSVLLLMILASYLVVLLSLIFYFSATYNDVFEYKGDIKAVKRLNRVVFWLLFAIGATVFLYLAYIAVTSGAYPQSRYFSYECIINANRYISLGIFIAFVVTDLLTWIAQSIQSRSAAADSEAQKENKNNVEFAIQSLILISLPCAFVCGLSILLHHYLAHSAFFHDRYDKNFVSGFLIVTIPPGDYTLFLDGVETGVIATLILLSQIVFAVLKAKWNYGKFLITGKCN